MVLWDIIMVARVGYRIRGIGYRDVPARLERRPILPPAVANAA